MKHALVAAALAASFWAAFLAARTGAADPRGFAMGGTDAVSARGADAVLWNPALLGLPGAPSFSWRIFQAGAQADNNSFNLDQYRRLNGATWDDAQKSEILGSVPGDGLELESQAGGGAGFAAGRVGVYAQGWAAGDARLARDGVDFALYGNSLDRWYDLKDSGGRAMASARMLVGLAWPVAGDARRGSLGLQIGIERGIRWEEGTALDAGFEATTDTAMAVGDFLRREGTRGNGFSVGLGYAHVGPSGARISVMVRDLYSRMSWTGTEQRYHLRGGHGIYGTESLDSLFVSSTDPEVPVQFTTRRSPVLDVGYEMAKGRCSQAFLFERGFGDSPGVSEQVRFAYGLELRGLGPAALRGGLSLGGGQGTWASCGLGLHAGPWRLDAGVGTRGIVPSHAHGLGLSVGSSVEF